MNGDQLDFLFFKDVATWLRSHRSVSQNCIDLRLASTCVFPYSNKISRYRSYGDTRC